ncbi:PPE domain-containing protein [Antrihabitans cavernicola]|uniref:PPE domain-containing protein n=1 Tax=Antrihabitans cavernicola TaxID=2495913 RepID=A0A5A7SFV3_9NOCA|nr:PPE domain-containing protein [Spelaeibacter cavernicola]KAA0024696.1 PPE domain-containing protein [Spelaeibacter cavernicola]
MTLGVTGVFWLPRTATGNSITLNTGAHAVPISAAGGAWGTLAAVYTEATATTARVIAELGAGLEGINGIGAIAQLTNFTGWTEHMAVNSALTSAKAAANVTAYTVASLAMPSLPEIAAVQAAKVAAYSTGGALNGTAELAEAADKAMDIRAALVMEAYEAATSVLAIPNDFAPSPAIAAGAPADDSKQNQSPDVFTDPVGAFTANPVQAASTLAGAVMNNPVVQGAVAQAGNIAGTATSAASSVATNIGGAAVSAVTSNLTGSLGGAPSMPMGGMAGLGAGAIGGAVASSASTRAVSLGAGSAAGGLGSSSGIKLPEGWGSPGSALGGASANGLNGSATMQDGLGAGARLDPALAGRTGNPGSMMPGRGTADGEDDAEHETPEYLKNFEHFSDGRTVIPSVIGGDGAAMEPVR